MSTTSRARRAPRRRRPRRRRRWRRAAPAPARRPAPGRLWAIMMWSRTSTANIGDSCLAAPRFRDRTRPVAERAGRPGSRRSAPAGRRRRRLAADQHVERRIREQPQRRLEPPPVAPARPPGRGDQADLARDEPQPAAVEGLAAGRRRPRPVAVPARLDHRRLEPRPPPAPSPARSPLALAWITRSQSSGRRRVRRSEAQPSAAASAARSGFTSTSVTSAPGSRAQSQAASAPDHARRRPPRSGRTASAPASQTTFSAVSMLAARTARPGGTPSGSGTAIAAGRREAGPGADAARRRRGRAAPPAPSTTAPDRGVAVLHREGNSPACSGARIRAALAARHPPRNTSASVPRLMAEYTVRTVTSPASGGRSDSARRPRRARGPRTRGIGPPSRPVKLGSSAT